MPTLNRFSVMCTLRAMPGKQLEVNGDILWYDADDDVFRDGDGTPVDAYSWIDDHKHGIKFA